MKFILKFLLGFLAILVVVFSAAMVAARFNDGPYGIIAGGAFSSGEQYTGIEPDWSFVKDIQEVAFQSIDPERSRTTWILEVDGRIYIPCGYMNTTWGKIWKQWPIEAEADGRVILRVEDRLYNRSLVRLKEGPRLAPVLAELSRKYMKGAGIPDAAVSSGSLWLFELTPRG